LEEVKEIETYKKEEIKESKEKDYFKWKKRVYVE